MITLLAHRHLYNEDDLDVAIVHVSVTTSAELSDVSTNLQSKGIKLHEGSKAWDITNSIQYGFTADGNWHEWESGTSIVTLKGRVDTVNDLPSSAQAGWMYFVGLSTDTELEEYVYTDAERWEHIGTTAITIDSALSTTSENPVQNKVVTTALGNKVDSSSLATVATSGEYGDLNGKPAIMTQQEYDDLQSKTLPLYFIYEP